MLALTYLAPSRMWLLVVVAGLAVAYVVVQSRRKGYTLRFTNIDLLASVAPNRPGWRRHLPAIALLLALGFQTVALARPAREERVPRERATIILAIDTSLSMEAQDVRPTRLKAAQEAAKSFLDIVPPKINVGLVGFNGNATVLATPTTDRAAVKVAIDQLQLAERTAIGEGIAASLDAIRQAPRSVEDPEGERVPARIVLMSDGETTVGRPDDQAAALARDRNVPVDTIAFGTPNGTITIENGDGRLVPTQVAVNKQALRAIADATDGRAYEAATESELRQIYRNIGSSVGFVTEFREIGRWFVGAAMVLLLAGSVMSLGWFSRLP